MIKMNSLKGTITTGNSNFPCVIRLDEDIIVPTCSLKYFVGCSTTVKNCIDC